MKQHKGFTLIEVLVALAVVAIGMAAVLEALTSSANAAVYLRDKTFAEWIALNQGERVRLSGELPATGTSTGHVRYAGRRWHWRQKVVQTQVPGVERIVVDVRPSSDASDSDDGDWYATVTGYVGKAIAPPNPLAPQWSPGAVGAQSGTGLGTQAPGQPSSSSSTQSGNPLGKPLSLP